MPMTTHYPNCQGVSNKIRSNLRHSRSQNSRSQISGFTLIELVTVIVLVGILAFFVGGRFFTTSIFTNRAAADEMLVAIKYTQQLAMSRGGQYRFEIDTSGGDPVYRVVNIATDSPVSNPADGDDYEKELDGISLNAITIVFDTLGRPYDAGGAELVKTDINIPNVTSQIRITIEAETGYAHLSFL